MSYIESSGKRAKEVMRGQSVWGFRLGCFLRLPVLNRVNPKSSPRTEVCRYTRKVGHSFHNACVRKLCARSVDCTGLHSDWSCQPYVHKFIQYRSVFDPMPRQVCANNCTVSIEHSTTAHHIPTQNRQGKHSAYSAMNRLLDPNARQPFKTNLTSAIQTPVQNQFV